MSKKREVKRAAHQFVADLILWEFDNNQSEAAQELINTYGYEDVDSALREIEAYHARLSGHQSAWTDR